jgi:hypothetical protein
LPGMGSDGMGSIIRWRRRRRRRSSWSENTIEDLPFTVPQSTTLPLWWHHFISSFTNRESGLISESASRGGDRRIETKGWDAHARKEDSVICLWAFCLGGGSGTHFLDVEIWACKHLQGFGISSWRHYKTMLTNRFSIMITIEFISSGFRLCKFKILNILYKSSTGTCPFSLAWFNLSQYVSSLQASIHREI